MIYITINTKYQINNQSVGGFFNSSNSITDFLIFIYGFYFGVAPKICSGPIWRPLHFYRGHCLSECRGLLWRQHRGWKIITATVRRGMRCGSLRFSAPQRLLLLFFFSLRLLMLCQTRRQLQSGVESISIKVISLRTLGVRATNDDTNKNKRRDRYSIKGRTVVKLRDPACAGTPAKRQLTALLN